jgi:hypothetical protein
MIVVLVRQVAEAVARDRAGAQNDVAKECEGVEVDFASKGLTSSFQILHVCVGVYVVSVSKSSCRRLGEVEIKLKKAKLIYFL